MLRALLMLLLMAVAGRVLGALLRSLPRNRREAPAPPTQRMVRCARCGVFVPAAEAIRDGAVDYCCREHRDQGPAGPS